MNQQQAIGGLFTMMTTPNDVKQWRPGNWKELYQYSSGDDGFEAGADAMLGVLKARGLYGEYGEDFIISNRVKPDDLDWAETFYKTIKDKGWLIFIEEEK